MAGLVGAARPLRGHAPGSAAALSRAPAGRRPAPARPRRPCPVPARWRDPACAPTAGAHLRLHGR
eukprot:8701963-Lingulodinium_polyedra.AAC.1